MCVCVYVGVCMCVVLFVCVVMCVLRWMCMCVCCMCVFVVKSDICMFDWCEHVRTFCVCIFCTITLFSADVCVCVCNREKLFFLLLVLLENWKW